MDFKLRVTISWYNGELTIGKAINEFRRVVPEAEICVFDNNPTDKTADITRSLGGAK
jgi:glycosyltransferase involved in cell wall biosynthesis